ncbi:MAG: carbohydrate ABC transporter permease [Lachnospiraceae bacterium]|jgi:ABC-type sugar transport system, permease component|nr:carbohydrate ABC transporter permease [Lachnospiraceae bacterium]
MHKKTKDRLTDLFITLILFAVALLIIVPMVWITICAFRPQKELMQYPPQFFTSNFTLQNFTEIARRIKIWGYVKNSVVYCLASTIPSVFLNSLAGYAFARLSFKGKNVLFIMILATMMIPFQVIMVPLFLEVYKMGMYDTFAGLIVPNLGAAITVFMTRAAFAMLPRELEEAARIDGLSEFGIFGRIMLPLVKPTIVTVIVLGINGAWNDLMWPLLITSNTNMRTVTNGLAMFIDSSLQYGTAFAGAFISICPMFVLYIFGQKYFVEGTASSGLKG